ncbi:MAG: UbiA prenyltransferase family protein [Myxococcales bacterium]|nr:UbiA prenyltransferase family protein [Myxococcales bacterium]
MFRSLLRAIDRFVRLHFLGFTILLLLLGASSVEPSLGREGMRLGTLVALMLVGLCFHNFAYVFNDVIDLPVDRTHPDRQDDYLVRGTISVQAALGFSLAQIPLALVITWLAGGGLVAMAYLLVGFGFMTVYDLWGKRCPVPPVTDLCQGIAWGSLAPYAAVVLGHQPNLLTWVGGLHGLGFIFLINGVHGGLRDLDNDLARGRLTTASFFGARPASEGKGLPLGLRAFAMSIQLGLIALGLLPLLLDHPRLDPGLRTAAFVAVGAIELVCLIHMLRVFRWGHPCWGRDFRVHLGLLLVPPIILFAFHVDLALALFMLGATFWPFLFLDIAHQLLDELRSRLGAGSRSRDEQTRA